MHCFDLFINSVNLMPYKHKPLGSLLKFTISNICKITKMQVLLMDVTHEIQTGYAYFYHSAI